MTFRFDLTDLRLFLHVVEAGSITAGAEASHLSLAAASARITGMEDSLGTPLLQRLPRGVLPTQAGRALTLHARTLLLQMERLRGDLTEYARGLRGLIQMLANTAAMQELLPEALGAFLREQPNVNVALAERPGEEVVAAVAEGTADLGLVNADIRTGALTTLPFRRYRMVLVVPAGHPLALEAQSGPVGMAQADEHGIVGLLEGTALQDEWERAAARRGRRLNYRARVASFDIQCRLVAQGAGIALMPEPAARRHAQQAACCIVQPPDASLQRELLLCLRRFEELPAYTRRLVECLREPAAPAAAG